MPSATILINNNTGGTAVITMCHQSSSSSTIDQGTWTVAAGQLGGPLTVNFETGPFIYDYWYCSASVIDGPSPGIYVTEGSAAAPKKECMLEQSDNGTNFTNWVSTTVFNMNQVSGGCKTPMTRTGPYSPITNVFVLMLENHSFDHLLGFSGIAGINGLTGSETNEYNGVTYTVTKGAVDPMTTDPNHEFQDTLDQLCGQPTNNPFPKGIYPPINNSGFAANYASVDDENTGLPGSGDIGDVLACCDSPSQVPALYQLACEFAVCDNWFSSMPGPTWPNRLFAMGGSSSGLDDSPSHTQIFDWVTIAGFQYVNGSIFQLLAKNKLQYRLYNDVNNQYAANPASPLDGGGFPIMAALNGIFLWDIESTAVFASNLQGAYPYQFTFIEPNYGDLLSDTYSGGSSQHPMDSLAAGEGLVAAVYSAIRNSPVWNTSLLIITYDEHGGFYDHVAPPPAPLPGDGNPYGYSTQDFPFTQYGVRVPAVVVSPLIAKGTVDNTLYDHTSMLKTVEELYGLPSLTDRDVAANNLTHLLSLDAPRTDCPTSISTAPVSAARGGPPLSETDKAAIDAEPLPEKGNLIGFLHIAAKTDIELQGSTDAAKTAVIARVKAIQTKGQARQYFQEIMTKAQAAKAARDTQ